MNQFKGIVDNIITGNSLSCNDFYFLPEGRNHNKALHISMDFKSTTLYCVLVDTGYSLNSLPKLALMKQNYKGVELRLSDMVVRYFDGTKRSVLGEFGFSLLYDGLSACLLLSFRSPFDSWGRCCYVHLV